MAAAEAASEGAAASDAHGAAQQLIGAGVNPLLAAALDAAPDVPPCPPLHALCRPGRRPRGASLSPPARPLSPTTHASAKMTGACFSKAADEVVCQSSTRKQLAGIQPQQKHRKAE